MNVSNVSSRDMAMWKAFAHDMADNPLGATITGILIFMAVDSVSTVLSFWHITNQFTSQVNPTLLTFIANKDIIYLPQR